MKKLVIEIPDRIVGKLMRKARNYNSALNKLRRACHPADIWIPFRDTDSVYRKELNRDYCWNTHDMVRELIIKGDNKDVVNRARIILHKYMKNEIGVDVVQMNPLFEEQTALERPWLERHEYKAQRIKTDSVRTKEEEMKTSAERCRDRSRKRKSSSDCQHEDSLRKSGVEKGKTGVHNPHISATPKPGPRTAMKADPDQGHLRKLKRLEEAEGDLMIMSVVGTCDDENEDIAKILDLPTAVATVNKCGDN